MRIFPSISLSPTVCLLWWLLAPSPGPLQAAETLGPPIPLPKPVPQQDTTVSALIRTNQCIPREEIDRCRSQVESLPLQEKRHQIKLWRDQNGAIRRRLHDALTTLRAKESQSGLSEAEQVRLRRLEILTKRFEQTNSTSARDPSQDPPPTPIPSTLRPARPEPNPNP